MKLIQTPSAGVNILKYAGDLLEITLEIQQSSVSKAFIRTNFHRQTSYRKSLIDSVEKQTCFNGCDWSDIEMTCTAPGYFRIVLPLSEVEVFDFKAFALTSSGQRIWCDGANTRVKVEPALSVGDNCIYNAFIRQFGPNVRGETSQDKAAAEAEKLLNAKNYTVIPPSGTFEDFNKQIHHVMDIMGFRIIMFLPVHPTPESFAKMGRFGSPFAPLNFFMVDASMAVFDKKTTPLEQFSKTVSAIHSKKGLCFIDIPLDHTGWASTMQVHHPEWFMRKEDGTFESPGAWGVVWEDLCKLDFSKKELWKYLVSILLHWCSIGIDGFRCDAGYMIPLNVWEYVIARVRQQYPDTLFFLEGLGGSFDTTRSLLLDGGMNWAYSEYFQEFGFHNESRYLKKALEISETDGVLVNFAETHDNNRLAAVSKKWSELRVASAALLAPAGAFGIANGVEWLAKEKIDVHGDASLNWDSEINIVRYIGAINKILSRHPAFHGGAKLTVMKSITGEAVTLLRSRLDEDVLVLTNPNCNNHVQVSWSVEEFNCGKTPWDLLSGRRLYLREEYGRLHVDMPPAMVLCLSAKALHEAEVPFPVVQLQCLKACILKVFACLNSNYNMEQHELERLAETVLQNPYNLFKSIFGNNYMPVVEWNPRRDSRRVVMLPSRHAVLIQSSNNFSAKLLCNGTVLEKAFSIEASNKISFAIFTCESIPSEQQNELTIVVEEYSRGTESDSKIYKGTLLQLPEPNGKSVQLSLCRDEISCGDSGLCANELSSYTVARAAWGALQSKYDALLAANLSCDFPDDRKALLLRFRAWLRWKDFSTQLDIQCQKYFSASYNNTLQWKFLVPLGLGRSIQLTAVWRLDKSANAGQMTFTLADNELNYADSEPVVLIVRPDIDCRSTHTVTKAYTGTETYFPDKLSVSSSGFDFIPGDTCLRLSTGEGSFNGESEWHYQQPLSVEQERGLETSTDIFSPGYFQFIVSQGDTVKINVAAAKQGQNLPVCGFSDVTVLNNESYRVKDALRRSLDYFIVKRNEHKSVIAGYPWFLDWGRDTLICLRGIISAGMLDIARDTICQFAQFEDGGTLPNMIRGKDTSDRDTSDAPLWFFAAVEDYIKQTGGNTEILSMDCKGRALGQILLSIAESAWRGMGNGVRVDQETGLLFSPPHFTWMDTNYPAGTPRCGYPVEIQALWINAMSFISRYLQQNPWLDRMNMAKAAFLTLFKREDGQGLSDCLHTDSFESALKAKADDAVRPNQLLAVTLFAIEERETVESILKVCSNLLTPAGIRTLDDASVSYPLPVVDNGKPLNDPCNPYWGNYSGLEDITRKPAYHNGTSWPWPMPLYCQALFTAHPEAADTCLELLSSAISVLNSGCLGFLPEIYDGSSPHTQKGCIAQAWSMTEFYRVWTLIDNNCTLEKED